MDNYCVNCKHYKSGLLMFGGPECWHPKNVKTDMVDGNTVTAYPVSYMRRCVCVGSLFVQRAKKIGLFRRLLGGNS